MAYAQEAGRTLYRKASWVRSTVALLALWWNRSRGRQELLMMTDRELRDLGIRRSDVLHEAHKPFWRP